MVTQFTEISDSQWQVMSEFLPVIRKRKLILRDIVDSILWLDRTGAQWRNLLDGFPPLKAVNYYFSQNHFVTAIVALFPKIMSFTKMPGSVGNTRSPDAFTPTFLSFFGKKLWVHGKAP